MNDVASPAASGNPMLLSITYFKRNNRPAGQRHHFEWSQLCEWIERNAPTAATKNDLPLIKLATFTGDYRTDLNLEAVFGIEGDYDAGKMQPSEAVVLLASKSVQAFVYTSPSHGPNNQRWRVLCPLSRPHGPNDRHALVGRLNGLLGDILAPESFTPSQAFYVGSVAGGHPLQCWRTEGRMIDAIEGLPIIAPPAPMDGQHHHKPLGTDRAPSFEAATKALQSIDPNDLSRDEWRNASFAFRQAATGHVHDDLVRMTWDSWCTAYNRPGEVDSEGDRKTNNPVKNEKLWRSADNGTQVGWSSLHWKAYGKPPQSDPMTLFGGVQHQLPPGASETPVQRQQPASSTPFGELLTASEQRQYFDGCTFITARKAIVDRRGVSYNAGTFNARFGGKKFIIDQQGKITDEAWKAATRSTLWTVPKVDDDCFLPDVAPGAISTDELGRTRLNTYVPAKIETMSGDPSPFLNHLAAMIPNADDQTIILEFMAHSVKFPGYKIPWAPLIQSTEGIGKNAFKYVMEHAIGDIYCYPPNAKELVESGSKFNGWMERKLFFVCDEIRSDEKRNMVEVLKPLISERKLEVQGKGIDQKKGDNPGNWMFFSNYKDAIPVNRNGRRFAVFYSAIQSEADLLARGMDKAYFDRLYGWLGDEQNGGHRTGLKIVAHCLLNHPIERGGIPMRAPQTTSTAEALIESRGPIASAIAEAIAQDTAGFRGGWISRTAARLLFPKKDYTTQSITAAIEELNYVKIGRATTSIFHENREKPELFSINPQANIADYRRAQGYE
jgi:hypothetical protein